MVSYRMRVGMMSRNETSPLTPLKMRQTYRQEMRYLLELTGFEIVNVYGGYNKESGEGSAKNVIWCVRKK